MLRPIALALLLATSAAHAQTQPNAPVPELDLARYAGLWHEIAHLPMYFQRKCVGDITAQYTPRPDGRIDVRNACRTRDGGQDEAIGEARPVPGHPGALEVRFAPAWLAWLPFVWGDYWVIELDPEYRWAMVGGPDQNQLWILSREPAMARDLFEDLKRRAAQRGYPVNELRIAGRVEPSPDGPDAAADAGAETQAGMEETEDASAAEEHPQLRR